MKSARRKTAQTYDPRGSARRSPTTAAGAMSVARPLRLFLSWASRAFFSAHAASRSTFLPAWRAALCGDAFGVPRLPCVCSRDECEQCDALHRLLC